MQKNTPYIASEPHNELGFLFWQIMKSWQREKQKLVDEFGITASQLEVLSAAYHLAKDEELEVTQIAIANSINVDPMTTSTVLRNLEKKDLIKRKQSKVDTRARIVEVTQEGEVLLLQAITKVDNSTKLILEKVNGDVLREQLRILLKVLTEINN